MLLIGISADQGCLKLFSTLMFKPEFKTKYKQKNAVYIRVAYDHKEIFIFSFLAPYPTHILYFKLLFLSSKYNK
jgi:hypothetical protein